MKKYILSLFVFGLVFSSGLITRAETVNTFKKVETVSSVPINRALNVGSKGEDVKALQNLLKEKGFLAKKVVATGYYGVQTKDAVKKYQKDANFINASGKVDVKTIEMIKTEQAIVSDRVYPSKTSTDNGIINTQPIAVQDIKPLPLPVVINPSGDTTPRIMYWYGKVNQHIDSTGNWRTDPDGVSGANLNRLEYCNKWFPGTKRVEDYKVEIIGTWMDRGNVQDQSRLKAYTTPKISTKCVRDSITAEPRVTVFSPNGGENYSLGQQIKVTWETTGFSTNAQVGIDLTQKIGDMYSAIRALAQTTNDGNEIVNIPTDVQIGDNYVITVGLYENGIGNQQIIDRSDRTFTINSSIVDCVSGSTAGATTLSLDPNSPFNMGVLAGTKNVEIARIDLANTGTQNVCLNGIHLGSSSDLNSFITNTKIIDMSTGLQVGQATNYFAYNGSYYYSWVYPTPSIAIPVGVRKVFKIISDFPLTATHSSFSAGIWGLNFDSPGAINYPQQVSGNTITVN